MATCSASPIAFGLPGTAKWKMTVPAIIECRDTLTTTADPAFSSLAQLGFGKDCYVSVLNLNRPVKVPRQVERRRQYV